MSDICMVNGKGKLSLKCKVLLGALALKDKEVIMSDMCMGNRKGKLSLKCQVLLGALALAVMAGLGTGVYAASANKSADKSLSGQTSIFNPFTLTRTTPTVRTPFRPVLANNLGGPQPIILLGEMTNLTKTMPIVRIPVRPVLRSSFRPTFIFRP